MTPSLLRLAALTALLLLAGHGDVRAADPPPPPAAAPATEAASPPPAPPAPAEAKPAAAPAAARPAEAKGPDGKPSPLHFEPTEKTRADFEVSFPSDI